MQQPVENSIFPRCIPLVFDYIVGERGAFYSLGVKVGQVSMIFLDLPQLRYMYNLALLIFT